MLIEYLLNGGDECLVISHPLDAGRSPEVDDRDLVAFAGVAYTIPERLDESLREGCLFGPREGLLESKANGSRLLRPTAHQWVELGVRIRECLSLALGGGKESNRAPIYSRPQ